MILRYFPEFKCEVPPTLGLNYDDKVNIMDLWFTSAYRTDNLNFYTVINYFLYELLSQLLSVFQLHAFGLTQKRIKNFMLCAKHVTCQSTMIVLLSLQIGFGLEINREGGRWQRQKLELINLYMIDLTKRAPLQLYL